MKLIEIMKDYYINLEEIRAVYSYSPKCKTTNKDINAAVNTLVEEAKKKKQYFPITTDKLSEKSIIQLKNGDIIGTRYNASILYKKITEEIDDTGARKPVREQHQDEKNTIKKKKSIYLNQVN